MKLAFNKQAKYPEFVSGYSLYIKRSRTKECQPLSVYKKVIKKYCEFLRKQLLDDGVADLPCGLGSIAAVTITRRPQYRGKKFIGYGKMDWSKGHYDGEPTAFGITYLPNRNKNQNLRCFGFVANRALFKQMKALFLSDDRPWTPMTFENEMI